MTVDVWAEVSAIWHRVRGRGGGSAGDRDFAVQVLTAARSRDHPLHPLFDWVADWSPGETTNPILVEQALHVIDQARRTGPAGGAALTLFGGEAP